MLHAVTAILIAPVLLAADPMTVAAVGTKPVTLQVRIHDTGHQVVSSVPAGTTVHTRVSAFPDLKTDPIPTGFATTTYYDDASCSIAAHTAIATLTNGAADVALARFTPSRAGPFSVRATYPGDANFSAAASACIPLTVTKATPSLAFRLELSGVEISTLAAGQETGYRLTISGPDGVVPATGRALIQFHAGTTCSNPSGSSSILLTNGTYSGHRTMHPAGEYSANATYEGDANWLPGVFAGCVRLTVTLARSALTTSIHDADHVAATTVDAGTVVHPHVDIDTGVRLGPTGTLRARAYADAACTTPAGSAVDVPVVRDRYDGSADVTDLAITAAPGTHSIRVVYSGNDSFLPVQGTCTPYTVTADPRASTAPPPTAATSTPPSGPAVSSAPTSTTSTPATSAPAIAARPGITAAPAVTAAPAITAGPGVTAQPAITAGPPITAGPADAGPQSSEPAIEPVPAAGAGDGGLLPVILLLAVALIVLSAGALIAQRRRRSIA